MDWAEGFKVASIIMAGSLAVMGAVVALIMWLGGWGLVVTFVFLFFALAAAIANQQ